jgi:hypothetical protein
MALTCEDGITSEQSKSVIRNQQVTGSSPVVGSIPQPTLEQYVSRYEEFTSRGVPRRAVVGKFVGLWMMNKSLSGVASASCASGAR